MLTGCTIYQQVTFDQQGSPTYGNNILVGRDISITDTGNGTYSVTYNSLLKDTVYTSSSYADLQNPNHTIYYGVSTFDINSDYGALVNSRFDIGSGSQRIYPVIKGNLSQNYNQVTELVSVTSGSISHGILANIPTN